MGKKAQIKLKTELTPQDSFVLEGATPTTTPAGSGKGQDPREKRTEPHTTMFTPEEWTAIRQAAFDQAVPHSDVIREAVCKHLGIPFDRMARK